MIDLHCHILPGLDDGPESLEEALKMAMIAERDGIEKIVATPHLFRSPFVYEDWSIIDKERNKFYQALKENNISVEIFSGAEVHISHNLIEEIRENRQSLVLNQGSYMFVEFPANHVYPNIQNVFSKLLSEGIIPIITHPERNSVFIHNPDLLYELISMGALAQANSGSFRGIYGKRVLETVFHFLKLNLVHFIASDCHNSSTIPPKLSDAVEKASRILGEDKARALVRENPQAVLDNKRLDFLPEPISSKEGKKTFKIRIPSLFKSKK